jgi:hypothetical protein
MQEHSATILSKSEFANKSTKHNVNLAALHRAELLYCQKYISTIEGSLTISLCNTYKRALIDLSTTGESMPHEPAAPPPTNDDSRYKIWIAM